MSNITTIKNFIEEGQSLKSVTQAYSEIASVKLARIRGQIEHSIAFAQELAGLHLLVRTEAAKRRAIALQKKPAIVHILLTSNYRFYGGLERDLIHFYLTVSQQIADRSPAVPSIRLVIGKSGASYLQATNYRQPYQPFIFKNDIPTLDDIRNFISKIKNYQTILVYHSQFKSVMIQTPQVADITLTAIKPKLPPANLDHIFEPEIAQILSFFDTQVMEVSLEQAFLESELARTAARLISMDQAQTKANDFIKNQKRLLSSSQRTINNNRLLETVSILRQQRHQR